MKTLVVLLGRSPGTVTGTFHALRGSDWGTMDRIITVTTDDRPAADDCERLIREEIERWQDAQGEASGKRPAGPAFDPRRISARDLADEASTDEFQLKIGEILQEVTNHGGEVYLGLAGGRKSMAALAAIAAQLVGADKIKMFHLYVTNRDIEECGEIDKLQTLDCANLKSRVMRPWADDYVLVEVPFAPESRINEFVYLQAQRRTREDSRWLLGLSDPVKENLWSYHYEVKVAEYVDRRRGSAPGQFQFDQAWHRQPLRDQYRRPFAGVPALDVYAERGERDRLLVLLGECKLSMKEQADRDKLSEGLHQLGRDQARIEDFIRSTKAKQGESRRVEFERWLVINVPHVPRDILNQAAAEGVRVMYARTPENWKTNVEWHVDQLRPAEPLPEPAS